MMLFKLAIRWLLGLILAAGAMPSGFANPGDLPLGYRIAGGAYPWTGRLHALAFKTAAISSSAVLTQWEAGERLDRQDIHTRHLYLGGHRLVPLRWTAIDDDARRLLDEIAPTDTGEARLSWMRGDLRNHALRPRDTRLGSATGARIHVVPPPAWLPMQPGHTAFRQRHVKRPTTAWLGTRDGLLHGFDAVTGRERAGYLPRAMLAGAAALTARDGPVPHAPCPRPVSIDADPSGTWRTLLLCGIPSRDTSSSKQTGAVFVLDVSAPDAGMPIGLLWEVAASPALPLSGSGPIGAAMWIEHGVRRWAAVAIVAPDDDTGARAGLALLPLDRPASTWLAGTNVRRMALPESGCGAATATVDLLAVTVASTASGIAQAAYATDTTGRLWRFGLDHLSSGAEAKPSACLHRQRSAGDRAEAPVVVRTGIGTLVVYGTGNELTAIPDRPGARGSPGRIDALPKDKGVVLRAARSDANPSDDGWTLTLPHADERIDTLYTASPVHVGFTTVAADGLQRSYLIDAASGESVVVADDLGIPGHAITGLPWTDGTVMPIGVVSPLTAGAPTTPGTSTRDGFGLDLWQVDGDTATLQQQARWHRRRGRLGWRELVRSPQ